MRRQTAVWLVAAFCAALYAQTASFQPGTMTVDRLRSAASAAGFRVREVMGDIPQAARSSIPFTPLEYEDPRLAALRKAHPLAELVSGARDEWTAQLRLKQWVAERIPGGTPKSSPKTALEILERAAKGERFWCTYYAITYAECAQALGWQARKLGVDRKHGPEGMESTHHGVAEVWSNQFRKWVVMDSQSNLHFEKKGVPLSAWEIRAEWLKNGAADVDHMVGIPPRAVKKNPAIVWWSRPEEDETATYFWMLIDDRAASTGPQAKFILPLDDAHTGHVWYQNGPAPGASRLHNGYIRNLFVPARRIEDAYWTVGVVEARVVSARASALGLKLDSYDPYRVAYEVSFDGVAWERASGEAVTWKLKPGWNMLRLRTAGQRGVTGPETAVAMLLEPAASR